MKCTVCQTKLRSAAIFCDTCGTKMEKGSQATIALHKPKPTPPAPKKPFPVNLLLGGAALLLVGVGAGAAMFSSSHMLSPKELPAQFKPEQTQDLKSDLALAKEPPASEPIVAPPESAPMSPPITEPMPQAVNPSKGQLANPFKKKTSENLAVDPFSNNKLSPSNPNGTLKPRFNDSLRDPFEKK